MLATHAMCILMSTVKSDEHGPAATITKVMFLFYTPDIDVNPCLSETESQHACRVLRLHAGDHIFHTDGRGTRYESEIINPHPKHCSLHIISRQQLPHPDFRIHIAIAPTKNIDRLEWMIEKCTEVGVDEITPLLCRYSERRVVKTERLQKIMESAAMQSLKTYMPCLNELTPIDDFLRSAQADQRFIAHCYEQQRTPLFHAVEKQRSTLVLIGPEGDFSEQEVQTAIQLGYRPVTLGNERLRTETAGLVACHTIHIKNEYS